MNFPSLLSPLKLTNSPRLSEAMGSKYKFWFEHPELGRCLYKQARLDLDEDWAEKVASEL
jgi:hypothetical protein